MSLDWRAVIRAAHDVEARTMMKPAILWCSRDIHAEAVRLTFDLPMSVPHRLTEWERSILEDPDIDPFLRGTVALFMPEWDSVVDPDRLVGLRLVADDHLPPGVWRLADRDQTLLYDCREGKHV